jgi:serine/threonine-protein kinase HipA
LQGKKSKLTSIHFETLGRELGLNEKQIQGVFSRFLKNKPKALKWIEDSFLSQDNKEKYASLLNQRYSRMELDP